MLNAVNVIRALEATSSRIDKEQIIFDAWMHGERQFFTGAILAYDKLISFGVAKVPAIEDGEIEDGSTFKFEDFLALAGKLRRRELTGHAARDAILDAIERTDIADWNDFYRRILLKDLRVGVKPKTINKILAKIAKSDRNAERYMVPVFSPQLAEDGSDEKNHQHLRGLKLLDLKLDGIRIVAELNKELGSVTLYTRHGDPNENFPHVNGAYAKLLPHLPGSVMLDGEMTARTFGELMEQLNRKNASTKTMRHALFDIIPLEDFRRGHSPMTEEQRHAVLVALTQTDFFKAAVDSPEGDIAYVLPKVPVDLDTEEGQETLAEMRRTTLAEKKAGAKTKEGVMVKDAHAPYVCDRVIHWLKLKPTISVTLRVVGIEKGKPGKKYANTLGAILCEGTSDCGKPVRVSVNGGIKDWMRAEWFADPTKIIDYLVEIEADDFSLAKGATVYSLRFPRLKERRGTKPGEKL